MPTYTFRPPVREAVPFVTRGTPDAQRTPWRFFAAPLARGVNVFALVGGGFTEEQPAEALIAHVYHGGHVHPLTQAEVDALTAAGYGPYITTDAVDSGLFGRGLFGRGRFGR